MSIPTLVVVSPKYKRLIAYLLLKHLAQPLLFKLMHNEVVVGVGHPLELPEEATTEEFSRRLGFLYLECVLYTFLGRF